MRKAFVLFLLLLAVVVGGVSAAAFGIGSRADQVTVSVVSQQGDPAVLKGLQADLHSYCQNLRWDTHFVPVTGEVDTQFRYMGNGGDDSRTTEASYGLTMRDETGHTMRYDPEDADPQGLDRVYHELAATTQRGEEGSKTVFLKDYVDYYQFDLHVSAPQDSFYWGHNWERMTKGEQELYKGFHDFFKIPVLPEETWNMTFRKNSSSDSVALGCGTTDSDKFDLIVGVENSVVTDSSIYFAFTNRTNKGKIMDTSLIPGGYGIYCLPIVQSFDPKTETAFRADKLHVAYPMEEETEFLGLRASKDKSRLILHTIENGWYVCTEIDIHTMTDIQRFEIAPLREKNNNWELWEDKEQDLFIVELFGERSALFYRTDGSYSLEFTYQHESVRLLELWRSDVAYNGEQLFVGGTDHWKDHTGMAFFTLAAYDDSGLRYYGEYDLSLSEGPEDNRVKEVKPTYREPIILTWS